MERNILYYTEILSLEFSLDDVHFEDLLSTEISEDNVGEQGNCENVDIQESEQRKQIWGEKETKLLLDKYKQYLPLVGPLKKFKKKRNMWVYFFRFAYFGCKANSNTMRK